MASGHSLLNGIKELLLRQTSLEVFVFGRGPSLELLGLVLGLKRLELLFREGVGSRSDESLIAECPQGSASDRFKVDQLLSGHLPQPLVEVLAHYRALDVLPHFSACRSLLRLFGRVEVHHTRQKRHLEPLTELFKRLLRVSDQILV